MKKIFCFMFFLLFIEVIMAQSHSQWRGPFRSGFYPETGLLTEWPAAGPELIWTAQGIGKGYSSVAVTEDAVFVTGMRDTLDYLFKLSITGEILWGIPFGRAWFNAFPETRCTPAIEDNRVYVLSGTGNIACVDAMDGTILWGFNAAERENGQWGEWGVCESLLLINDLVIYTPAGVSTTIVALQKLTGKTVWRSESLNDTSAYVSPLLIRYGGREIVVTLTARYLFGVDALNGSILWKFDYASLMPEESLKIWPGAPFTNTNTPLFDQGRLYITGGYNHVGAQFQLSEDAGTIHLVWTDSILDCHIGGVVLVDGFIYGSNWINNANGNWCCLDWQTGKPRYEEKWFTKGSIITAENMLYCYEERTGHIGLVKALPEKFELVSSFKIPEGTGPHWAHPVIRDGVLYLRHGDVVMAYGIRK